MFRAVIPRMASNSRAVAQQFAPHTRGLKKSSSLCNHRYWYPSSRNTSWLDDAFRSPSDMMHRMDRQLKDMFGACSRVTLASRPGRCRGWVFDAPSVDNIQVKHTSTVWEVRLPVKEFSVESLAVRVSDNRVSVSGKQEEIADAHGYISRQFDRTFLIPENVESDTLSSSITEDGILVIRGTVKQSDEDGAAERVINIERSKDGTTKKETDGRTQEKSE